MDIMEIVPSEQVDNCLLAVSQDDDMFEFGDGEYQICRLINDVWIDIFSGDTVTFPGSSDVGCWWVHTRVILQSVNWN